MPDPRQKFVWQHDDTIAFRLIRLVQEVSYQDEHGDYTGEYIMLSADDQHISFIREDVTGPIHFFTLTYKEIPHA